jgi:hypothetical protein
MRWLLTIVTALAMAAPAGAATAAKPWPPREGPGHLFVHYGEEHWNDIDGEVVLTQVVADVIRFRPDLVTMSGDKTDDGTTERLEKWRSIMDAYDRAGVPYFAGVGNHDGKQATPEAITEIAAGSTPLRDIVFYKQVFAGRPYPFGDAAPYPNPLMAPKARPVDDPEGASSHYYVDYGNARWVFLDNSCYGIQNCDPLQNPPDGQGRTQYEFLRAAAEEASAKGMVVFVVAHMPTQDPRDQSYATTTSINHTMGKGTSPDNAQLEQEAEALGVDGVFLAHIKGQWQYKGRGGVPYYIDGGAGGELYSEGPLGVDHGYWYGWRLVRVDGTTITTDVVPVISAGGISIQGAPRLTVGEQPLTWQGFAKQPATKSSRAVVTRLELRDPDPIPPGGEGRAFTPPWTLLGWLSPLFALALLVAVRLPRRRVLAAAVPVAMAGIVAAAGAQRSEPTSTPKDALPNPARIWTTGDPTVLAPVASTTDDPRRDAATQTADGAFRPVCPGRTSLTLTSGHEEASTPVQVASSPGPLVTSLRRARRVRAGRGLRTLATLRLPQHVRVQASLRRNGRRVGRIAPSCMAPGVRRLRLRVAKRGRYTLQVTVASDRKPLVRRLKFRVR